MVRMWITILFKCVCLTICVSNFLLEYMMVYIQYDIRCFLIWIYIMRIQIATYLENRMQPTLWTPKSIQDVLASKAAAEAWLGGAVREVFHEKKTFKPSLLLLFRHVFLGKTCLAKKLCLLKKSHCCPAGAFWRAAMFFKGRIDPLLSLYRFQGWNLLDHLAKA